MGPIGIQRIVPLVTLPIIRVARRRIIEKIYRCLEKREIISKSNWAKTKKAQIPINTLRKYNRNIDGATDFKIIMLRKSKNIMENEKLISLVKNPNIGFCLFTLKL